MKEGFIIWDLLGIEPTVDIKVIKRAYAGKLKIYHPEDDPEGFQKLREAYDSALKEAKYIKEVKSANSAIEDNNEIDTLIYENKKINTKVSSSSFEIKEIDVDSNCEKLSDIFMSKVEELYNQFFLRIDSNQWKALLKDDAFLRIDVKQNLNYKMVNFLMDNYNLPHEVWVLLDEHFYWHEQELNLYEDFPTEPHMTKVIWFLSP